MVATGWVTEEDVVMGMNVVRGKRYLLSNGEISHPIEYDYYSDYAVREVGDDEPADDPADDEPDEVQPVKLTTHKTDQTGNYVVKADGRDTGLRIEKSEPAKYGMVQEWDVMVNNRFLFSAKGKSNCLDILQEIIDKVTA